jgi:hypothetical protein
MAYQRAHVGVAAVLRCDVGTLPPCTATHFCERIQKVVAAGPVGEGRLSSGMNASGPPQQPGMTTLLQATSYSSSRRAMPAPAAEAWQPPAASVASSSRRQHRRHRSRPPRRRRRRRVHGARRLRGCRLAGTAIAAGRCWLLLVTFGWLLLLAAT